MKDNPTDEKKHKYIAEETHLHLNYRSHDMILLTFSVSSIDTVSGQEIFSNKQSVRGYIIKT